MDWPASGAPERTDGVGGGLQGKGYRGSIFLTHTNKSARTAQVNAWWGGAEATGTTEGYLVYMFNPYET